VPTTAELVARSSELKRELVEYAQRPRYHRAFREALAATGPEPAGGDERRQILFLDYFALQHRFANGRSVMDQFLAARPDLSDDDRELVLGWRAVVEGIFEVLGREEDALLVRNLIDEATYRVHSNTGPEVFDRMPSDSFLMTRLIPVGPDWLISGATGVIPGDQREEVHRRAAELARRRQAPRRSDPTGPGADPAPPGTAGPESDPGPDPDRER
jgi:hypothetical protein